MQKLRIRKTDKRVVVPGLGLLTTRMVGDVHVYDSLGGLPKFPEREEVLTPGAEVLKVVVQTTVWPWI